MSEDEAPSIDLSKKRKLLRKAIIDNPSEAWVQLQEDPSMVLVLASIKRDLENDKRENVVDFFDEYDRHVKTIFGKEYPIDHYGIALATEFLVEYWRRSINSTDLSTLNEAIMKKMAIMIEATDQLPESDEKKITNKIVEFSAQRILDYADYDRMKAKEHYKNIESEVDQFIDAIIEQSNIEKIMSLAYFASASTESIGIFRDKIAHLLFNRLKNKFDTFSEEDKFKIAPYLGVFKQIVEKSEKNSEPNQPL